MCHTKEQVVSLGGPGGLKETEGRLLNENGGVGGFFFVKKALTLLISPICLYTRLIHAVAGETS